MAGTGDGKLRNGHFITKIVEKLKCVDDDANDALSLGISMKIISYQDLVGSKLLKPGTQILIGSAEEEEEDAQEQEAPVKQDVPMQDQGAPGYQPFDFSDWTRQFNDFRTTQDQNWGRLNQRLDVIDYRMEQMVAHQVLFGEEVRYQGSRVEQLAYNQEYYQPHMTHWARGQSETSRIPVDDYRGPPIFTPTWQYGGFSWPPPQ